MHLRSFVGNIALGEAQLDPAKVSAVTEWPAPTSCKMLERFLGLPIFTGESLISGHIILDFVTGLPPSNGKTIIVLCLSPPLPKLPSARETADLLVEPTDMVSDRVPQFISQVWRAFCTALSALHCPHPPGVPIPRVECTHHFAQRLFWYVTSYLFPLQPTSCLLHRNKDWLCPLSKLTCVAASKVGDKQNCFAPLLHKDAKPH